MSVFDGCSDQCGWIAALIAVVAYGSFGVPIRATKHIDVHPWVLQSYKTFVVFIISWGVTLLGVEVAFTRWGLLSGLLWVLGGTGGIYGIRTAGLAIAVGTWASIMIVINFVVGILLFHERVNDIWGTSASFALLILGLIGMCYFSAPSNQNAFENSDDGSHEDRLQELLSDPEPQAEYESLDGENPQVQVEGDGDGVQISPDEESISNDSDIDDENDEPHVTLFGCLPLTKRQCGILGAAGNGVVGGGCLIPLHYAKKEGFGGANYMISMACGALLATILIWVLYFVAVMLFSQTDFSSLGAVADRMPKWHFRKLCIPGFMAGLLLSIAMFGNILAVTYLGQGVGNSLVQTKIIVGGVWGIFYYKEIVRKGTILKWFLSAVATVAAIIWLSLERLSASGGGAH